MRKREKSREALACLNAARRSASVGSGDGSVGSRSGSIWDPDLGQLVSHMGSRSQPGAPPSPVLSPAVLKARGRTWTGWSPGDGRRTVWR